jgi:hypothetical protein
MKRIASAFLLLIFVSLMTGSVADAAAIRIKEVAMPPNESPKGTPWRILNGLRVVGKGAVVILSLDTTGSGLTGSPSWTLDVRPSGSLTVLDSTSTWQTSFTTDTTGPYYVTVSFGGASASDTILSSTYRGVTDVGGANCVCHTGGTIPPLTGVFSGWSTSGHASIFNQGVSGMLEVIPTVKSGLYKESCIQCHTVGFDVNLNNGNFGYLSHSLPAPSPNSWDSTWFKNILGITRLTDGSGDLLIPTDSSMAAVNALPTAMKGLNVIGCENCHGPLTDHSTWGSPYIGNHLSAAVSYDAGVCNQCHNGSGRHSIGSYYNLSLHAQEPVDAARGSCAPCHMGAGIIKWAANHKDTTGFAAGMLTASDIYTPISCQACHDPHTTALRDLAVDSLRNGFQYMPAGKSEVCSYCHSSRYSVKVRVTSNASKLYGFTDRYGPHENPQYDMLIGSNGYEYGDSSLSGIGTHKVLPDGCVTCHMQGRTRSGNTLANHSMKMDGDTAWGFNPVTVCKNCHGEIEDFNDIKASYDYDGNGKIEGVQTEVQGLLDKLKSRLPLDATGEPITMKTDSNAIVGHPELVQGIWNYYFVKNDGSMGVHNTKYAVSLLQKALGTYPLDVKTINRIPTIYALNQNYPNPFNPSTTISFSLPQTQNVRVDVFDILGNLVKTMVNGSYPVGTHQVIWNGVDKNGARVSSGVYIYRLIAGPFTSTKKMLLMK